jgi:hypothetical protein
MELRGVGVVAENTLPWAEADLAVLCVSAVERLPDPERYRVAGTMLPALRLQALEPSAAAKLERALASRS